MLFVFLATEVYVQQGGQTSGNSVSVLIEPSWSRWEEKGGKKKPTNNKKSRQSGKIRHPVVTLKFTGRGSISP